jgi:hypothetical protein
MMSHHETTRFIMAANMAEEYYLRLAGLDRKDVSSEELAAHSAAIAMLDMAGEEEGCARHPAFWGWGSGQQPKARIEVWSMAIRAVARRCSVGGSPPFYGGVFHPEIERLVFVTDDGRRVLLGREHGPPGWRLRVAREGLLRSAGYPPQLRMIHVISIPHDLPIWSTVVRSITEEIRKE